MSVYIMVFHLYFMPLIHGGDDAVADYCACAVEQSSLVGLSEQSLNTSVQIMPHICE